VKYEFKSPDCFKKLAITIKGRSPGPTIQVHEGDTIIAELKNSLLTRGTPWFDGTEGVTQCPMVPGETFKYQFDVDRPGTYLYHAHYGMQREAGLQGMIRVALPDGQSEPFAYDYDRSIILSNWYHKSTYEQATGLSSLNFTWVGEPQSLLIHGKGKFDCSKLTTPSLEADVCNETKPECSPYVMTVISRKTYRLRIGSLTALPALSFQIEGHNMTIVEADGHYVEPIVVQNLFIYSGETYSVLIKTDQNPSTNYWIKSDIVSRNTMTPSGLPTPSGWNDVVSRLTQSLSIKARNGHNRPPPLTSDRVIVLLNTQNTINGQCRWSVNNYSFTLPHTPYLIALKHKLTDQFDQKPPPDGYDFVNYDIYKTQKNTTATSSDEIYRLKFNTTVDIILQNANSMVNKTSETHPWHLHGHDFWVLGYGSGKFDIYNDPKKYNLVNPIEKNTVAVQPYGWTALRFRVDNPGVWAFHCHIESHFYMGMGVVFEEGIDSVGKLPNSIMGCGSSKNFIKT
ncbi:hypothetical protein UlMin_038191, partial [Ulmus minor]